MFILKRIAFGLNVISCQNSWKLMHVNRTSITLNNKKNHRIFGISPTFIMNILRPKVSTISEWMTVLIFIHILYIDFPIQSYQICDQLGQIRIFPRSFLARDFPIQWLFQFPISPSILKWYTSLPSSASSLIAGSTNKYLFIQYI